MSSEGFDALASSARDRLKWLRNYVKAARKVKRIAEGLFGNARVFVFGSVVRGDYTAASDIDVLVVLSESPEPTKAAELRARVYFEMPDAPVEVHITTEEKFKGWYMRFIKPDELIEV